MTVALSYIFVSDDEPRPDDKEDLGGGEIYRFLTNTLSSVQHDSSGVSRALQMHERDHLDLAAQQNKTAKTLRVISLVGFLMIAANIAVMSQIDDTATRIVLGGASALGISLVYYLRATIIPANRELLSHRKEIRSATVEIERQERDIGILRSLLLSNPEQSLTVWRALQKRPQSG